MNLLTLLVGQPGMGKTTSMRNLGADTVIFNTERKELPFRSKGVKNIPINSSHELLGRYDETGKPIPDANGIPQWGWLAQAAASPNIKTIIIDSFSDYTSFVDQEAQAETAHLSSKERSFRRWDVYNNSIQILFNRLKQIQGKYIILTGHPEYLQLEEGYSVIRMAVKGKQWEGMVEKTATCVFYADASLKADGSNRVDYRFVTNTNGKIPAKTPMDMFPELYIENDLEKIVKVYDEYYAYLKPAPPEQSPGTSQNGQAKAQ